MGILVVLRVAIRVADDFRSHHPESARHQRSPGRRHRSCRFYRSGMPSVRLVRELGRVYGAKTDTVFPAVLFSAHIDRDRPAADRRHSEMHPHQIPHLPPSLKPVRMDGRSPSASTFAATDVFPFISFFSGCRSLLSHIIDTRV